MAKHHDNNNFSATVPYDMEQQKKEMKEFLDDLTTREQSNLHRHGQNMFLRPPRSFY